MKRTYSAVVESGSCSVDQRRWHERAHCGHAHRTVAAAQRCLDKHARHYCQHGRVAGTLCSRCLGFAKADSCSAEWYNACIHTQDGERVDELGQTSSDWSGSAWAENEAHNA